MFLRQVLGSILMVALPAIAVPRPMTEAELTEKATHVITGTVVSKAESTPTPGFDVRINGVVEVQVESVQKGAEVVPGDRVAVHYWHITPNPNPIKPPPIGGTFGQWCIPAEADRIRVFVTGNRRVGFNVIENDGFKKLSP
jgi:hypothetical protein